MKVLEGRLQRSPQGAAWPASAMLRRAANPVMIFLEDWRNSAVRDYFSRAWKVDAPQETYLARRSAYFRKMVAPPALRSRFKAVMKATRPVMMIHHQPDLVRGRPRPWNNSAYYDTMFLGRHRLLPHSGTSNA